MKGLALFACGAILGVAIAAMCVAAGDDWR